MPAYISQSDNSPHRQQPLNHLPRRNTVHLIPPILDPRQDEQRIGIDLPHLDPPAKQRVVDTTPPDMRQPAHLE
jgi:hypothetical protein